MILLSFLILTATLFVFYYQIKHRRRNHLLSKIPGPKKVPLFHNTLEFIGMNVEEMLKWLEDGCKKYGPVYHITMNPFDTGFAFVSDVKVIEALLTSQVLLKKTVDYDLLIPWIGTGLLISTDKKWFQRRKLLTPGFHFQILEKFVEIMHEQAKVFVKQLAKYDGRDVDIFPLVNLCALDVICEASMGVNIHAQTSESEYLQAVKEITIIESIRSFDETKRNEFLFKFTKMYKREQECLKILHGFTNGIIKKRRDDLMNIANDDNENNHEDFEDGKKKRKALLDILLSSTIDGEPLSDSDIREEVDTFMFAGHDTTSSGISFTLYNIAKYPEVQQKIYEEIMDVFGDDAEVTVQKLNDLRYLDLVIKESLRLFPPVPFFGRQISEELTAGGYTFPKNMSIYVSPYLVRMNPEIFPNPEKFDPYRFDVETTYEKTNPFAYIPFSAGPRNCIGQKFAQYEIRTIVLNIVRNYKLILCKEAENLKLKSEAVLRPVNPILIHVEKRQ